MPSRQDASGAKRRSDRGQMAQRPGAGLSSRRYRAGQADAASDPHAGAAPDEFARRLAVWVEGEVLPRMMMTHGLASARAAGEAPAGASIATLVDGLQVARALRTPDNSGFGPGGTGPGGMGFGETGFGEFGAVDACPGEFNRSAVDDFARAAIGEDTGLLIARVDRAMLGGATLQEIYLELLAGAARRLGDMWRHDECSFVDVTIGLSKLHLIVQEFMDTCDQAAPRIGQARGALFATPPAEDHSFGLVLVEDAFRRAGWRTASAPGGAIPEIAGMAQAGWFDVFGLGLSCERHLEQAVRLVREVRRQSRNRDIKVLVGGRVFAEQPDLAAEVGADLTALRADEAVRIAETAACLRA